MVTVETNVSTSTLTISSILEIFLSFYSIFFVSCVTLHWLVHSHVKKKKLTPAVYAPVLLLLVLNLYFANYKQLLDEVFYDIQNSQRLRLIIQTEKTWLSSLDKCLVLRHTDQT